ncbi:MAG TPA: ABC transporter ATP-binding protein [Phaeodactylibacter sp.]|nr:ABC transporter ATP-binding protein [Phaeodactylibacter sp.]
MNSIEAQELTKKFGDFTAVNRITFEVKKGEVFGFLGANGAGKTTAIRMLTGLLMPSSGEARVAGFDIYKEPEQIKRNIGYMSQKFSLYQDLTPRENIRFFGGIYGLSYKEIRRQSKELIGRLGMEKVANKQVSELPLGWKQRLAFSLALLHEPKIVFLDEPTSGVDPITRRTFWELIHQEADAGTTIFVTTHYMDEAEYCRRLSVMVAGRIEALGSPLQLKQSFESQNMDQVFLKLAQKDIVRQQS